jgi:hypothetical protein
MCAMVRLGIARCAGMRHATGSRVYFVWRFARGGMTGRGHRRFAERLRAHPAGFLRKATSFHSGQWRRAVTEGVGDRRETSRGPFTRRRRVQDDSGKEAGALRQAQDRLRRGLLWEALKAVDYFARRSTHAASLVLRTKARPLLTTGVVQHLPSRILARASSV